SASCGSGGFGYAGHAARKMRSPPPQSRKASAASQNWSLDRHQRSMHALPNQRGAKSLVGALPLAKSGIVGRRVNKSRQPSRKVIADFFKKIGTKLPIRNVRSPVANGGKADNI